MHKNNNNNNNNKKKKKKTRNIFRGEESEKSFGVKIGVRKGKVFSLYLDSCLKRKCIRENREHTLAYADDTAVRSGSDNLREDINKWIDVLNSMGMWKNRGKTVVMLIAREREEIVVNIEGTRLKQVSKFNYLGMAFDEEGRLEDELRERIRRFSKNVGRLYQLLKERGIQTEVKVLIYKTILRSILVYGSECWTVNTVYKSRIEATEMRVLRIFRGVSLRDSMSELVREELGVESILE
ncbi:UNVERIFIED_CONTAM: hypothetical protein RMT77_013904 [Armadillidium vulgare]